MGALPREVLDEDGCVYRLAAEPLGRGGQGVVFRTQDPNVAVKLIMPPMASFRRGQGRVSEQLFDRLTRLPEADPTIGWEARQALKHRLEGVRLLPIAGMNVARPMALLLGEVGYTMQLLSEMVPIHRLIAPPGTSDVRGFYCQGGGLRRRLHLLGRLARLLTRLHGLPAAYADLSPNNVFVSESVDAAEVWLIDLDNVALESIAGTTVHTLGYGAPEIVTGRSGANTLSDSWAFAVLAFQILAQTHPFLGDFVESGGWEDDEDRESMAFEGRLPWIDDPRDLRNASGRGLPRGTILTPVLRELFARTFEGGRMHPSERPGVARWSEALSRAGDSTLACSCGWTFFLERAGCPMCKKPCAPFLKVQVNRWDSEVDGDAVHSSDPSSPLWYLLLQPTRDAAATIPRHVTHPLLAESDDVPALEIQLIDLGVLVTPLDDQEYWLVVDKQQPRLVDHPLLAPLTVDKPIRIHCGPLDSSEGEYRSHRLLTLRMTPGLR